MFTIDSIKREYILQDTIDDLQQNLINFTNLLKTFNSDNIREVVSNINTVKNSLKVLVKICEDESVYDILNEFKGKIEILIKATEIIVKLKVLQDESSVIDSKIDVLCSVTTSVFEDINIESLTEFYKQSILNDIRQIEEIDLEESEL